MSTEEKISIDTFKAVTRAIAHSRSLDLMTSHLAQLLVAALEIKASAIFVLDLETKRLEILGSFGLSPRYLSKGPLLARKSFAANLEGEPVVVADVAHDERIQYPEEAQKEGIAAILSVPIAVSGSLLGALRLYHHDVWHISDQDMDSLLLLADYVGLAMNYTSLINAIHSINDVIHMEIPVSLIPKSERK
jgi:transcriptional regulator with GAF, ATPase, and Fis domain